MSKFIKKHPGFTFVELLFAIVVMGILFSIALVVFVGMLRFYVFAGSVRQNQENGRNVLDSITRDIRFGQLLYPTTFSATGEQRVCIYNPQSKYMTGYYYDSSVNPKTLKKVTSNSAYQSFNEAKTANNTVITPTANSVCSGSDTASDILAKNMYPTGFNVIKTKGADPNVDIYGNIAAVTIEFSFITQTAGSVGSVCEVRNIYCSKITYNTAVELRGGDTPLASIESAARISSVRADVTGATYVAQFSTGSSSTPFGIAYDAAGYVYVVNQSANNINKYDRSGNLISTFGSGLNVPRGLAVDSAGNIYVANAAGNNIQKYSSSGTLVATIGTAGSGDGQLNAPSGVFVDGSGNIYVADANNNRIQKFNSSGVYQIKFGSTGTGDGQFIGPYGPFGVAVDGSGNIFVVNPSGNSLQKFSSSGAFLAKVTTGLYSPNNLAVDSLGNIYVANTSNNNITIYNNVLTSKIATIGSAGSGNGQFSSVPAVSIDSSGYIWATDLGNNRVEQFKISYNYY
jgi:prepilin-type N-terminal cleavage/methylation domain-containing protein